MILSSDEEFSKKINELYVFLTKILMLRKDCFVPELNKLTEFDESVWKGFSYKGDLINWMKRRTQALEELALIIEGFVDEDTILSLLEDSSSPETKSSTLTGK